MKIVIKNPAPLGKNLEKWGDYHFGASLGRELQIQGAEVIHHYWPEWDRDEGEDLVIVLRGKRRYVPSSRALSLLWVISHPATVLSDELEAYNRVLVASETHYDMIRNNGRVDVDIARQCTDTSIFTSGVGEETRRGVTFVANSRGIRREILSWAISSGVKVDLVGGHWRAFGLDGMVRGEYISNTDLPFFYQASRLTLNDHWGDMVHFGYINNRIFDCLACGTPILSDVFPELKNVCGEKILYASNKQDFWQAMQRYYLNYPDVLEGVRRLWGDISSNYTFKARAIQIMEWANENKWARKAVKSYATPDSLIGDRTAFLVAADNAIDGIRKRGVSREIQTLHLFPTPLGTSSVFRRDDVSYLSGGFGLGAWHTSIDTQLTLFADSHFDLIAIEDSVPLQELGTDAMRAFAAAIARKLSAAGGVALGTSHSAAFQECLRAILGDERVIAGDIGVPHSTTETARIMG